MADKDEETRMRDSVKYHMIHACLCVLQPWKLNASDRNVIREIRRSRGIARVSE